VSIRRNEDQASDRFVALDAEIAALKEKLATVQALYAQPRRTADALLGTVEKTAVDPNDVVGLRSSLHDLAASQHGAVAAITKRLDRIEVMVGMSTDVTSSLANPLERQQTRRKAVAEKPVKKPAVVQPTALPEATAERTVAQPERGHMFNFKPISQQGAPLRISRLPG
jgi:carboxylesterase type B